MLHSQLRRRRALRASGGGLREGEARVCVGPRSAVFAPIERPRADRGRRGARRPPTSTRAIRATTRATSPPSGRARCGAVLLLGQRDAARRRACSAMPRLAPAAARRRPPAAAGRGARHARRGVTACIRTTAQALADVRAARRQGDRAAEPPRLVELPLLPLVRARVELPALRRRARAAPRRRLRRLPPLRPPRAGARALRRVLLGIGRAPRRRHRAPRSTSSRACSTTAPSRLPPRRRRRGRRRPGGGERGRRRGEERRRPDGVPGALLRRFEAADCGVLIGTQMVAKGHDFPDVTLGVVLDADATLRFPDFRAEERTFALIAQLAGRVGRGSDGRVLVQTIAPRGACDRARRRPRQRRLPRRRARAPARARLPAVLAPDQDRLLGRGRRRPRARPRRRCAGDCGRDGAATDGTRVGARSRLAVPPARPRAPGARGQGRRAASGGARGRRGGRRRRRRRPAHRRAASASTSIRSSSAFVLERIHFFPFCRCGCMLRIARMRDKF